MNKRSAETELTKDSVLCDGEDLQRRDSIEDIRLRSREDVLKSGKPIIRLRRTIPVVEPTSLTVKSNNLTASTAEQNFEGPASDGGVQKEIENTEEAETAEATSCTDAEAESKVLERQQSEHSDISRSPASPLQSSSIFGTLFSKPFTNPFATAAKSGESNFALSSPIVAPSSPQLFGSSSIFSIPAATNSPNTTNRNATSGSSTTDDSNDISEDVTSTATPISASTPRPAEFPGEEEEREIFCEINAILLKCVPVGPLSPSSANNQVQECAKSTPSMKFKKQGEGVLKLLAPKEVPHNGCTLNDPADKENTGDKKRRLVLRQKGTWTVLLNSPLWLSKTFEVVTQMTSGYGVRFVGLDHAKCGEGTSYTPLAAYCIKFESDAKRREFLSAVGHPNP